VWLDVCLSPEIEGGFSNRNLRDDPGGPTMYGVTLETLRRWRAPRQATIEDLKKLTIEEARAIASAGYWNKVQGDKLPAGLDLLAGDFALNSGPRQAVKTLQKCLGFTGDAVDGFIGPNTMSACLAADPHKLIRDYSTARLSFMRRLSNWESNKNGWTKRVATMQDLALQLAPARSVAATAQKRSDKFSLCSLIQIGGVAVSTVLPAVIEAMPTAKHAYDETVVLFTPYAELAPWFVPVIGAGVILGILYTRARNARLTALALKTGATEVAVAS
jgi:lysozyme family protein